VISHWQPYQLLYDALIFRGGSQWQLRKGCTVGIKAALEEYNNENGTSFEIRQMKYLNNIVEQEHRGVGIKTLSLG
jgi:transposase-like protein